MTTLRTISALVALGLAAGMGDAGECRRTTFEGQGYAVCEAVAGEDLRLFLYDAEGLPVGTFERLSHAVAPEEKSVVFAMNAGMYHADRRPVGLYVEKGTEEARLITSDGPGNFGMLPNGVFCIRPDSLAVIESRRFAAAAPDCSYATQSGPMLVIDGALHPMFLETSDSLNLRNGVGVTAAGDRAFFVISDGAVNFHQFARFFRDGLGARQALYFDGSVSRLFAPGLGRADIGFPMGPIVALLAPAD